MSKPISSARANCKEPVEFVIPRGPIGFEFSIKSNGKGVTKNSPQRNSFFFAGPLIVISQVRPGGTAERAGLKCGSILKSVNKQPIDGLTFLQVSNMIRRTRFGDASAFFSNFNFAHAAPV